MIRIRLFRWFAGLVLLGILSGPALIAAFALRQPNSVTLPEPSGPYAVGRIIAAWRDDARVDPFAPVAGTKRDLPVWIWYPAARGGAQPRVEYMPALVRDAMQPHPPLLLRLTVLPLTTDRANVTAHALDAPPLLAEPPTFPVVVLKPALGAAVVQNSLPSVMTAAYRLRSVGLTEGLGRMTPGDDYQRLIPLMDAIPAWLHAMLVAAGTCYLITAICLVARRRTASLVLLAGVTIEFSSQALSKPILATAGVIVTPNPSVLAAVLLPVVFPLLLAVAAWSGSRRDSDLLQA